MENIWLVYFSRKLVYKDIVRPGREVQRLVLGLESTQHLMLGIQPTLSVRFLILGHLSRQLLSGRLQQRLKR